MKLFKDGNWQETIKKYMTKDRLLIMFLAGVLIFIVCLPTGKNLGEKAESGGILSSKSSDSQTGGQSSQTDQISEMEYKSMLEKQLGEVLSSAYGVGNAKIMITLESGSESVVKEDSKVSDSVVTEEDSQGGVRKTKENNKESSAVYENDGTNSKPYVIKENMPSIAGVLIIADGADKAEVVQNISDAVKALFDVDAHKIKVMKMVN